MDFNVNHVSKSFSGVLALSDVSLTVKSNEFVAVLGPSGCGKTTLLRLMAGLCRPDSGNIDLQGKTAFVFQNNALFPYMNVYENIAFGLTVKHTDKREIKTRVEETAEILGLSEKVFCYPYELSGGQQRRVALGRAAVLRPDLFLLDEPLTGIDETKREQLRKFIYKLKSSLSAAVIMVTHDLGDAVFSDKVILMRAGKVEQSGTFSELYSNPCNLFVATTMGKLNVFTVGGDCLVGLRPEDMTGNSNYKVEAVVTKVAGGKTNVLINGQPAEIVSNGYGEGDKIELYINKEKMLIFKKNGERTWKENLEF